MLLKYTSMIVNFVLSNILVCLLHWPVSSLRGQPGHIWLCFPCHWLWHL